MAISHQLIGSPATQVEQVSQQERQEGETGWGGCG